jgi:hypothetical protein
MTIMVRKQSFVILAGRIKWRRAAKPAAVPYGQVFIWMKRLFLVLIFIVYFVVAIGCGTQAVQDDLPHTTVNTAQPEQDAPQQAALEIFYFHETVCGSCDGTEEFIALFNELLTPDEKASYDYQIRDYNIFQTGGRDFYKQKLEELGIDASDAQAPVMIFNGKAYSGMTDIGENLRAAFLAAVGD